MDEPTSVPALAAPPRKADNPLTRSVAGVLGLGFLGLMVLACLLSLPYTLAPVVDPAARAAAEASGDELPRGTPRYAAGNPNAGRLPPVWAPADERDLRRLNAAVPATVVEQLANELAVTPDELLAAESGPLAEALRAHHHRTLLGTDALGRSLWARVLLGGSISLGIGIAAAALSVCIGTLYGAIAGYAGGLIDSVMMRIVDVLYGLPYILLVVLLAVAVDAVVDNMIAENVPRIAAQREVYVQSALSALPEAERTPAATERLQIQALDRFGTGEPTAATRTTINVVTLLVAIGGVSWLTMARVVRGQVLSLKNQPFVEAARAVGAPTRRIFLRHLLPNLLGPVIVYATLTVPQAILQESFLSFLGIGVQPPLPSWGNLAADGLNEINTTRSNWWLLLFPCLLLGSTLLALNFVGEGLREAFDPKRARVA